MRRLCGAYASIVRHLFLNVDWLDKIAFQIVVTMRHLCGACALLELVWPKLHLKLWSLCVTSAALVRCLNWSDQNPTSNCRHYASLVRRLCAA